MLRDNIMRHNVSRKNCHESANGACHASHKVMTRMVVLLDVSVIASSGGTRFVASAELAERLLTSMCQHAHVTLLCLNKVSSLASQQHGCWYGCALQVRACVLCLNPLPTLVYCYAPSSCGAVSVYAGRQNRYFKSSCSLLDSLAPICAPCASWGAVQAFLCTGAQARGGCRRGCPRQRDARQVFLYLKHF